MERETRQNSDGEEKLQVSYPLSYMNTIAGHNMISLIRSVQK